MCDYFQSNPDYILQSAALGDRSVDGMSPNAPVRQLVWVSLQSVANSLVPTKLLGAAVSSLYVKLSPRQ